VTRAFMPAAFFPGHGFFTGGVLRKAPTFQRLRLARRVHIYRPDGGRRAEDPFR
jgi:hypothetical protein